MAELIENNEADIIQASWEESKHIGLDPNAVPYVDENYSKSFQDTVLESNFVSLLTKAELDALHGIPLELVLFNLDGFIVAHKNSGQKTPGLLSPGVSVLEHHTGTTAFSLAAKCNKSCLIQGDQHYLKIFKGVVTFAVPLRAGKKNVGFIGFLIRQSAFNPPVNQLLISLTRLVGVMMEKCLREQELSEELDLIHQYLFNERDGIAAMAVNCKCRIVYANRTILNVLGIGGNAVYGKNLNEFLGSGYAAILEAGSSQLNNIRVDTPRGVVHCRAKAAKVFGCDGCQLGWVIEFSIEHPQDIKVARAPKYDFDYIIGDTTDLLRCINIARVVANSNSTVLITGESGTGKEIFAQAIHNSSNYKDGPFIAINSSAIPSELMESELFGYTDGAFTGAKKGGLVGKFLLANGGTLFLDEIGDMPLELQPKLLRVLQDRRITPLGGNEPIDLNIRIISATHQDLQDLIRKGTFRSDLYYRLNVVEINIPPLRERKEDIPILAEYFLKKYSYLMNKKIASISPGAIEILMAYGWYGNVRELENVIESAVNLADGSVLLAKQLPLQIIKESSAVISQQNDHGGAVNSLLQMEKQEILKALDIYNGNIKEAAKALQIGRTTLYRRIDEFGLLEYIQTIRKKHI